MNTPTSSFDPSDEASSSEALGSDPLAAATGAAADSPRAKRARRSTRGARTSAGEGDRSRSTPQAPSGSQSVQASPDGSFVDRLARLPPGRSITPADRLARNLGWFSLALGTLELFAPRSITRGLGIEGREGLVRFYGLRELGSGIGALSVSKRAGMSSRVVGDALDLATLAALLPRSRRPVNVLAAIGVVGAVTTLDWLCKRALAARERKADAPLRDYADRSGFSRSPEQMRGAAPDTLDAAGSASRESPVARSTGSAGMH